MLPLTYFSERRIGKESRSVDMIHAKDFSAMDMKSIESAKKAAIDRDAELARALQ